MAVKIQSITVIDDSRNLINLNDFTATSDITFSGTGSIRVPSGTTAERPSFPSVGDIRFNTDEGSLEKFDGVSWSIFSVQDVIAGSLDKTFASGETVDINLSRSAGVAPAVSVAKEVPQTGETNNDWDVAADGSNFTLHDTAYDTTLAPSDATSDGTFTLGSGSFATEDVGKRIVGNGGEAVLTATNGSYELKTAFNNDSPIAAGDWSMFALDVESAELGLKLSGYPSGSASTHDIFSDNSIVATYNFDGDANDLGGNYNGTWVGTENYVEGKYGQAADFNGVDSYIQVNSSFGSVFDYNNRYTISLWLINTNEINLNFGNSQGNTGLSASSSFNRIYISKPDNSSGNRYLYDFPDGFEVGDHAVIVKTGDETLDFYKNGSFMATWSPTFNGAANDGDNTIGLGIGYYTDGAYDQFRIFNRALSSSEIQTLYNEESFITFATDTNHTAITTLSTDTEFWNDINSMTADDASNDGAVYYAVSTDDRATWSVINNEVSNETENLNVTVATGELYQGGGSTGNVFYIEGNENPTMGLTRGNTYIFDQSDSSNSNHPLRFQLTDGTSYTDGITVNGTPGTSGSNVTFVVPSDAPSDLEYYCDVHGLGMGGFISVQDISNVRDIVRNNSGQWEINDASGYLTEIWTSTTTNDEFYALEDAATSTTNRMNSTQLNAVTDGNHYMVADDLDLAITLFIPEGGTTSPTSDGVSINYDASISLKSAIPGVDYTYDVPESTTVRFEALSDENFKVRVS